MIQKRVTRALLACVAAVITAWAAAGVCVAAQADTAGRPDLTEQWPLNRDLSDDAPEKLAEGSGPASSLGVAGVLPRPVTGGHDRNRAKNSRMRQYVRNVAGPGPLVGTFLVAGVEQLGDVPEAWDQDLGGYGRRLASVWGRFTIQTTVTHALAAVLDRPAHYRPCECAGRWQRVHHALLGTITEPASEGGRTLAYPHIAGVYAGAFTQRAWIPGNADARDALKSGTAFIAASAIWNLVQEFLGRRMPIPAMH